MIQKINKHLQKIKINVLVFLPNIDQKLIEIFKKTYKIPQIKFFITNNFAIDLKKISFLKMRFYNEGIKGIREYLFTEV